MFYDLFMLIYITLSPKTEKSAKSVHFDFCMKCRDTSQVQAEKKNTILPNLENFNFC